MTTAAYVRVSTNGQADAFGPEIQLDAIKRWIYDDRATLDAVYCDEGISGTTLDRPGLGEAMTELGEGDRLVFARLDRLARDLITQELLLREFRRKGVTLVTCAAAEQEYLREDPSDPSRRLIRQVLGAVAEYEREMVKLRLSLGRKAKRAKGTSAVASRG